MRRRIFGFLLLGLVAAPLAARADLPAPAEPIAALDDGLLTVMKEGPTTPFPRRFAMLAPTIERVFDLPGILRACIGPRWAMLGAQDQAGLLEVFRRFTVASYVANFDNFAGERFEIAPDLRSLGTDQVVETRIVAPGEITRLDYVMRQEADAWKAVDVLLEGTISRVAVQRSDFRGLLGSSGDVSALIASLQHKVADLSRGTLSAG
jgi:phospholipid transport system substrate-binding protein